MEELYNKNVELEGENKALKKYLMKTGQDFTDLSELSQSYTGSITDREELGVSHGDESVHNICIDPTSESFLVNRRRDI